MRMRPMMQWVRKRALTRNQIAGHLGLLSLRNCGKRDLQPFKPSTLRASCYSSRSRPRQRVAMHSRLFTHSRMWDQSFQMNSIVISPTPKTPPGIFILTWIEGPLSILAQWEQTRDAALLTRCCFNEDYFCLGALQIKQVNEDKIATDRPTSLQFKLVKGVGRPESKGAEIFLAARCLHLLEIWRHSRAVGWVLFSLVIPYHHSYNWKVILGQK